MDKPGRNDPCYCGSGKKYKQCHMAADLAAEREQRAWLDAARDLRLALAEFADAERFTGALGEAAARYWNNYYSAESLPLMSLAESERFLDWFIFDYELPDEGLRPIEVFSQENHSSLNATEAQLLAQWMEAGPMSGYELTGFERQILSVVEMLSGESFSVYEPAGHGNAPIGSIILGRLIPVQDHLEFFALPAYIPPEEIADLPEKLAEARRDRPGTALADFLRAENVLFIHHALEQARQAGRPPVTRLDPHHAPEGVPQRPRHERKRIKGPATQPTESLPHMAQTRRKAI